MVSNSLFRLLSFVSISTASSIINCVQDSRHRIYSTNDGELFYWEGGMVNWQSARIDNTTIELVNSQETDITFMEVGGESILNFGYDLSSQGNYSVNPTLNNPNLSLSSNNQTQPKDYVYNSHSGGGIKSSRDILIFGEFNITDGSDFQGLLLFNTATVTKLPLTNLTNARGFYYERTFFILMNQCITDVQYRLRGNLDLQLLCSGNEGRYLSSQLVNNTIYAIRELNNQMYLDNYSVLNQVWSSNVITDQLNPGCVIDKDSSPFYLTWSNPSSPASLLKFTSPASSKSIGLAVGLSIVGCLLLGLIGILAYRHLNSKRHSVSKEHLCRPEDILPPSSLTKPQPPQFHPTLAIFDSPRQEFI